MTKIKICGLSREEDVAYVNAARPDWCGFVIQFPKSRRSISPERAARLRAGLDPAITPVGVFVDRPVKEVAALLNEGTVAVAQLHGSEDGDYIAALRKLAPGREIWQAFQVRTARDAARASSSPADLVLLDSGQGSGRVFNWSLAALVGRPFLLAGGLTPENLPQAIRAAHPYGVDLSSGVEIDGLKNRKKIQAAVAAVRKEG